MTPLPPPPTFNRESVVPATTGGRSPQQNPLSGAATGSPPPGFVLVRISLLEKLHDQIIQIKRERDELQRQTRDMPAFLQAPSRPYLDAIARGPE